MINVRAVASGLLIVLGAGLLWLTVRSRSGLDGPAPRGTAGHDTAADTRPMADPAVLLDPGPPGRERRHVPSRPPLSGSETPVPEPDREAAIDLTNLIDAAKGDPVLFNYFTAIREQILRTAGARDWLSDAADSGLVYVSFTLGADGSLRAAAVVTERSVDSGPLQEAALGIVRQAAPFPAFPPSMTAPAATLVVPLEFLHGS